jgi:hypothetical protein
VTRKQKHLLKRLKSEGPMSSQGDVDLEQAFVSLYQMEYAYKVARAQGVLTSWGGVIHQDDVFAITSQGRAALSIDWAKWSTVTAVISLILYFSSLVF